MSSPTKTCSPRLKRLMDISHIVPLIFFFFSQLLIWLHPRVNKLNVIHGNSSLLLSLPISPPPISFFSLSRCGLSLSAERYFVHSKQPILEKKEKTSSGFNLNPTWMEPASCHHLILSEEGKKRRCFLLNVQIFQILKTHLVLFRRKRKKSKRNSHLLWGRY